MSNEAGLVRSFLEREKIGLILRVFSARPQLVKGQVQSISETVFQALELGPEAIFSRIDVLVSADESRLDSDCGLTADALRDALSPMVQAHKISIVEVKHGDIYCGLLNYGIVSQLRDRIDYSVVLSSEARSYLNFATISKMIEAVRAGARVVGVALEELAELVQKGRIANTFAMWHNPSLMTVGGFDLRAAKPKKDDRLARYLRGWNGAEEVFYQLAGVEEIIPLIRLVETFGACIAPVLPQGVGVKTWIAPDKVADVEGYARHLKKMGTKEQRQTAFAAMEGVDLSFLEGGVMPAYQR